MFIPTQKIYELTLTKRLRYFHLVWKLKKISFIILAIRLITRIFYLNSKLIQLMIFNPFAYIISSHFIVFFRPQVAFL